MVSFYSTTPSIKRSGFAVIAWGMNVEKCLRHAFIPGRS